MPATLTLDTLRDASIEVVNDRLRGRRTGILRGIDTTLPKEQIFSRAINHPDMPVYFSAWPDPNYSYCRLSRHVFDPIAVDKLRVTLLYEPFETDLTGGIVFVLSRRTYLVDEPTEIDPATGKPLRIKWKNPNDVQAQPKFDTVGAHRLVPYQSVSCSAWVRGTIPDAMLDCIGTVNSVNFIGRAKGVWMCSGEDDRTNDRGRSSNFTFEFSRRMGKVTTTIGKRDRDWRQFYFFRDRETGLVRPVADADVDALQQAAYTYGFDNSKFGVLMWGPYDVADFGAIFGIGG